MAPNAKIRKAVFDKLGLTQPGFSRRVSRLRATLPMTYDDAIYVLAHQNGIDIGRELDAPTLARISDYVSRQTHGAIPADSTVSHRRSSKGGQPPPVIEFAGVRIGAIPALLPRHANEAKTMSEKVYPIVYLFENSARDLITGVLRSALGDEWWSHVPLEVRNQAEQNMRKSGEEAWHSRRAHPIQCVDLPLLKNIVSDSALWPYFQPIFSRRTWFESVVDDINVSRRVVAHMNPLSDDDIRSVENGFRKWVRQLQAKASLLPS